jgi:hypothetical protein
MGIFSTPINKQTKIICESFPNDTSSKPFNFGIVYLSKERPPYIHYVGPEYANLTGKTFGLLTVIGLFIKQNPKKNATWLVLCKCGYYTTRKAKGLKTPISTPKCPYCRNVNR